MPQGGDVYRVRIMSSGTRGASGTQDLIDLMGKTKLTGRKRKSAQEVAETASRKLFKTTDTAQGDGDEAEPTTQDSSSTLRCHGTPREVVGLPTDASSLPLHRHCTLLSSRRLADAIILTFQTMIQEFIT